MSKVERKIFPKKVKVAIFHSRDEENNFQMILGSARYLAFKFSPLIKSWAFKFCPTSNIMFSNLPPPPLLIEPIPASCKFLLHAKKTIGKISVKT